MFLSSWRKMWSRSSHSVAGRRATGLDRRRIRRMPTVEELEARVVPSVAHINLVRANVIPSSVPVQYAYTPTQIQQAYNFSLVQFSSGAAGDGSGQTIAIVDAFDN